MGNKFKYIPISIKLVQDSGQSSCSGVIFKQHTNDDLLLLSTSAILVGLDKPHNDHGHGAYSYELSVSSLGNVTVDSVTWYPVDIVASAPISSINRFLESVPMYRVMPWAADGVSVTLMKLKSPSAGEHFEHEFSQVSLLTALEAKQYSVGSRVKIRSSPYSLINSALFMGFETNSNLAYTNGDFMLIDGRYLEGMEGGIVFDTDESSPRKSLGLVCGNLSKHSNNDGGAGGLLVVASWNSIFTSLKHLAKGMVELVANSNIAIEAADESVNTDNTELAVSSVIYLIVHTKSRAITTWGSGVVLSPGVIVTNLHVIDNYRAITAYTATGTAVDVEVFSEPLQGVDLVYLKFDSDMYPNLLPIQISHKVLKRGIPVRSVGYGLFYPQASFAEKKYPIVSEGSISGIIRLPLSENSAVGHTTLSDPVMMVCSSKCWNGSSGGAVIDNIGLVGIMSSNGRNKATGMQIPELAFVIPIDVVMYGLKLAERGLRIQVNQRVQQLWNLGTTHKTIVSKL